MPTVAVTINSDGVAVVDRRHTPDFRLRVIYDPTQIAKIADPFTGQTCRWLVDLQATSSFYRSRSIKVVTTYYMQTEVVGKNKEMPEGLLWDNPNDGWLSSIVMVVLAKMVYSNDAHALYLHLIKVM